MTPVTSIQDGFLCVATAWVSLAAGAVAGGQSNATFRALPQTGVRLRSSRNRINISSRDRRSWGLAGRESRVGVLLGHSDVGPAVPGVGAWTNPW